MRKQKSKNESLKILQLLIVDKDNGNDDANRAHSNKPSNFNTPETSFDVIC